MHGGVVVVGGCTFVKQGRVGRANQMLKSYSYICFFKYQMRVFCTFTFASTTLPAAGLFSRVLLRGTQEPRPYTAAHTWAQARLGGACSRRQKSHELALFHRIAFGPVEPRRTMETPHFVLLCCCCIMFVITPSLKPSKPSSAQLCGSHGTTAAVVVQTLNVVVQ